MSRAERDRHASPGGALASGWVEAFLFVLAIAVLSIVYAVTAALGAHVIVFILYSMLISGVAVLALLGVDARARDISREPMTWVVGLSNIAMEACYFLVLVWIQPAEGSLLVRLSLPVAVLIGAVMFARRPGPVRWLGAAIAALGILVQAAGLDLDRQLPGLAAALACAVMVNVRSFASEFHPHNRAARTVADKMRITGVVVLVTALACVPLLAGLMFAQAVDVLPAGPLLPQPAHLLHPPTIAGALLVGAGIFTAMNYLTFSAVVKIETSNFIAISAIIPPATLAVQWLAASLGIIAAPVIGWRLVLAIALVSAGVALIVSAARTGARYR